MNRQKERARISQAVMMGQAGGALQTLLNKFKAAGDDIAVQQDLQPVSVDYMLATHIGGGLYSTTILRTSAGFTSWLLTQIRYALAPVNDNAAGTAYTGAWTTGNDAAYYGGTYRHSIVTGATATYTTPAGSTRVGIIGFPVSNAGLAKVEIDNDATLAHLLPTAQELVDAGTFPNTILVANGGSLNPTDRVFDEYSTTSYKQKKFIFADNLTAGVHALKLTVTGYKRAAASGNRLYIEGWLSGGVATRANGNFLCKKDDVFSGSSVYEYAFQPLPTGIVNAVFVGNAHGNDTQTALTFDVDGVAPTLANTMAAVGGDSVTVTRTSQLYHPNLNGGATPICDVTTIYRLNKSTGLTISCDFGWLVAGTIEYGYPAMLPADNKLNRGSNLGAALDYDLTADDGSYVANAKSRAAYVWEKTGNLAALLHVPSLAAAVTNWTYALTNAVQIEDRALGTTNKIYLYRWSGGGVEAFGIGTHWTYDINYRVQYFAAGAELALAR